MTNLRLFAFLFAVVLILVTPACTVPHDFPPSTVLVVTRGAQTDITVMGGTSDVELLRFDVTNVSERDVEIPLLAANVTGLDSSARDADTMSDVKFTDAHGRTLMGPRDLDGFHTGVSFEGDAQVIAAGETVTFVLRADVGDAADRLVVYSGAFDCTDGCDLSMLGPHDHNHLIFRATFVDTGEPVALDRIRSNDELARIVNIMPVEMASVPHGTTALVADFVPVQGILHPEEYATLGTLTLTSYGGRSVFNGMDVSGANIGLFRSIALVDASGLYASDQIAPISACSCGTIRMLAPVEIADSESISFEVRGLLSSDSDRGDITFAPETGGLSAASADGTDFVALYSRDDESHFRVWNTHPVVTARELATHELANGIEQQLYSAQFDTASTGRSLHIGSLTFRVNIRSGGSLSGLRLDIDGSRLSTATYRIVRTGDGSTVAVGDTLTGHETGTEQITVVFTDPDGLLITDSGHTLTLLATPSGFASGDTVETFFGDYIFSTSVFSWGNMTDTGRITAVAGEEGLVDPIVWMADTGTGGVYTGAWQITDLSRFGILTAH